MRPSVDSRPLAGARSALLTDRAKGRCLLWGALIVLAAFALIEVVAALWRGRMPTLVETLFFALLACDCLILLAFVHRPLDQDVGWLGLLSVWLLGLMPYFGWAPIYALGKSLTGALHPRWTNAAAPPLIVWILVVLLYAAVLLE
jgi:hypothetical protein